MVKAAVRERDGLRCTKCRMTNDVHVELTGRQLDVHRVVPGSPYTLDGCVTLCRRCHGPEPKRPMGTVFDKPKSIRIRARLAESAAIAAVSLAQHLPEYVNDALRMRLEQEGHWPPPPRP